MSEHYFTPHDITVYKKPEQKNKPGYHLTNIKKGQIGQLSKIQEELDEAKDAELQKSKIMVAVELSDVIGAIKLYAEKELNLTLEDLINFSEITQRAFINGHRS